MLSDVSGQPEGVQYLQRIIDRKPSPPLLLIGSSGTGRRYSVVQAAKEIFCQGTKESGCKCSDCFQVDQGIHPDLVTVSGIGDKDIGVDVIRQAVSQSYLSPSMAPIRVIIIDGVEKLTSAASNALLKTLEEPPPTSIFFLLSESYDQIIPTIKSRCGRVPYHKLPESFIISLMGTFEKDPVKALVYTRIAEGSVGRAVQLWGSNRLKLRDQVYSVLLHCVNRDLSSIFSGIDDMGKDLAQSLVFLDQLLHDLFIIPLDPVRVINQDIQGQLIEMRTKGTDKDWFMLRAEFKLVQERNASSYINLPFHIKSALVNAFFV